VITFKPQQTFKKDFFAMTKKTEGKLKYQIILDQFLKEREWSDEYEINSEEKAVSLNTGINICEGHSGRLIVEASDQTDYVDVYIYYSQTCKEAKLDEMAILLNGIHRRWHFGKFTVFKDGYIRWSHRVDFEGSQPTGLSLERIVQPGWTTTEKFADIIAAVALTKQSAADALAEYDAEQEN
jgi:hypothetical protein